MLNFKSNDSTSSQVYQNPNLDSADQLNNSMYYHIANYLMFDEDHGESLEKNPLSIDKDIGFIVHDDHNNVLSNNIGGGSSDSVDPVAHNIALEKYNTTHEELRFAFRTKTDLDVMDDGYKWRKYGKKMMKNSPNPRNYFKCSYGGCNVKKRVERDCDDPTYVITTYQGVHNHAS